MCTSTTVAEGASGDVRCWCKKSIPIIEKKKKKLSSQKLNAKATSQRRRNEMNEQKERGFTSHIEGQGRQNREGVFRVSGDGKRIQSEIPSLPRAAGK